MLLLGVDFETTGLDVEKDLILEVGAVLWDTERKAPVEFISGFVSHPELSIKPEITELTGIDVKLIKDHGGEDVVSHLIYMSDKAEYFVAHNARGFDKPIYENQLIRMGHRWKHPQKWIDTRTDVPYPKSITTRNLKYLLAEHGMVNPFPHRALTDALYMMLLLDKYNITEVIEISMTPTLRVMACVTYDNRQKAKDKSYHWDSKAGIWSKLIKKNQLEQEKSFCDFTIKVIEEIA